MAAMLETLTCALTNIPVMKNNDQTCGNCGNDIKIIGGLPFCTTCNDNHGQFYNSLSLAINEFSGDSDKVLIECPGATLYHPDTNEVLSGVRFYNDNDPSQGYEIITQIVYGPGHVKKRWVKKENAKMIRRCQSCQDHTIRMRRKEGPDLFIPSHKYDNRRPKKPYCQNGSDNYLFKG